MRSKYLTIKPSTVYSDYKGDFFPDIFSFPINSFKMTSIPQKYKLSRSDIDRFDILMYKYYGICDYDDLVLWLNNIADIQTIIPGTEIFLPSKEDIETFYRNYML